MAKKNKSTRRNWKDISLAALPKIKKAMRKGWFAENEIDPLTPTAIKKKVGSYFMCYTVLNKLVKMGHVERRYNHKNEGRHYVEYRVIS